MQSPRPDFGPPAHPTAAGGTTAPWIQPLAECRDKALAGGKAVNLGKLIRGGFPVPGGFVVTTAGYRLAAGQGEPGAAPSDPSDPSDPVATNGDNAPARGLPPDLADAAVRAYRALGSPPVAVRSSATAEDMAEASMAGQYDTFLDVRGEAALLDAVRCCWASLDSPRTRAYLADHGIDLARVAMAVVVQSLVPADVAGVLFTANPRTGSRQEMLVEASWGLGESVVSGLVQPDVLRLEGQTGRVIEAAIADKQVWIPAGGAEGRHDEKPVEEGRRRLPCLRWGDVAKLWKLGRRAAEHFGAPQDLEWAIHRGELYLLQSRPITTLEEAESYENLLSATRAELREKLNAGSGPWVLHNIAETLSHATPLTWGVIRRFMSGAGGFGAMYRQVGFEPSAKVCREGFLERIAGKLYMDASAGPEMFYEGYPFRYDLDLLRASPDAGQQPPTVACGSLAARMRVGQKVAKVGASVRALSENLDRELRDKTIPEFCAYVREEKGRDLSPLPASELIDLWRRREQKVLGEFAPQSLLPSLVVGMALGELRAFLEEHFWDEDPDALANALSSGHAPDLTARANGELYEVAAGRRPVEAWLAQFGHRAPDEMELSTPRWRERPGDLLALAARLKDGADPAALHAANAKKTEGKLAELRSRLAAAGGRGGKSAGEELDRRLARVRRYLPFREDGKYYLMLGYDLLRDAAREMGRRLEIGDDAFLLSDEELFDALKIGFAPHHLIAQRKARRRAERRVPLPPVIDAAAVDALGEAPATDSSGALGAFAVSSGVASGPAAIVHSPAEAGELGRGYVLVCPSTDPAWTPLFVNAAALILECGGTLSHGAVVAREMSIPAVVLPGATTIFKAGETITVDGRTGSVSRAAGAGGESAGGGSAGGESIAGQGAVADAAPPRADSSDTRVARELVPPPPGEGERRSGRLRNKGLIVWGAYLAAVFLLPDAWLYQPTMALLDLLLWPFVRALGKPGVVVLVAAGLAALTMVGQRLLTDNARLREAKRRAGILTREAQPLPKGSPRREALRRLAAPVQGRTFAASMVPLAVLLAPMVMTFLWFPGRVDPAAWNPPPGSPVNVVAAYDANRAQAQPPPVSLGVADPLRLSDPSGAEFSPAPLRRTLEGLRDLWQEEPADRAPLPLDVRLVAEFARKEMLEDLTAYLERGVTPQPKTWRVLAKKGASGKFPVTLKTAGAEPLTVDVVLGDNSPPAPAEAAGAPGSPLVSLKVVYDKPQEKPVFWAPLRWLGKKWEKWDAGWLALYLVVYVPVMFALRWALRVA